MSLRSLTRSLVLSLLPPLSDDLTTLKQVSEHIAREVRLDVQGTSRKTWGDVNVGVKGWVSLFSTLRLSFTMRVM